MTEPARQSRDPWGPPGDAGARHASAPPLEATDVRKSYRHEDGSVLEVLQGINLVVQAGEAVAVIGDSGAGKSTLLHLLGALDSPSEGEVRLAGRSLVGLDDKAIAAARNRHVGFVFQFHHLLAEFTALENVMMPCLIGGAEIDDARARAAALLGEVGLTARMEHKPWQLSGGEQQRVAVVRALANRPAVLLADEPSGNLDHHTAKRLHDTLFSLRENHGLSMVLVTHNLELAHRADRILHLQDGVLHETGRGTPL